MNKLNIKGAACSLLLALAFALVFYAFNTPLGPSIGSDNAIYLTMGTALAQGYAPYTEIFDHKGPLVFALQAIPQLLSGGYSTLAVFLQQLIFLFVCLRVIAAIAREMGVRHVLFPQIAYLALICSLVGGGNLTEEYTNLFTLLGLLIIVKTFGPAAKPRADRALTAPAAALGALTMLCFLTRANNALPLAGAVLALSLWLLLSRRFAALGFCALGFLAGCALAALPVTLWLLSQGALGASIYGALIHNMMYAETAGESRIVMLLTSGYGHCAILMAALSCLGAACVPGQCPGPHFRRKSAEYDNARSCLIEHAALPMAMIAGAAMGGLAAFVSHKYYDHYLILSAPMAVLGVCALLACAERMDKRKMTALLCAGLLVCASWLAVKGNETNRWRLSERADLSQFTEDAQALYAIVPEEERDRFMGYRVEPRWYAVTGALPCMRFYFLQEILAQADPAVMDEIVAEFDDHPPKWLVIYYNREFGPPYDERVAEVFTNDYEFIDARGQYQLLRLKESL